MYTIALNCLYTKRYNQIVYQFAHELTHVFISPYVVHPLAEIFACAASLAMLDAIADEWSMHSDQRVVEYASKFREYKNRVVEQATSHIDLAHEPIQDWCKTCQIDCEDRTAQLLAAQQVAKRMNSLESWSPFRMVFAGILENSQGGESNPWRSSVSTAKWRQACEKSKNCASIDVELIDEIQILFNLPD
mmetsp:Transcript_27874/g.44652  ORF Transcript_27874/g.44652 Transcript_27874/m.44652 type:complete len:190 (-) Transcript_27874:1363-1932(-)